MVMDAQLGAPGDNLMDEKFLDSPTRIETAPMEIGLSAAIICVRDDEPEVLTLKPEANGHAGADALPYGPFSPVQHRTLDSGLRSWVEEQTELELGYVEQLYTFGDRGRQRQPDDSNPHIVSIGYLAFTRPANEEAKRNTRWRSWYDFFPWEDWRQGKPELLSEIIEPLLQEWAAKPASPSSPATPQRRQQRLRITFGMDGGTWDEEKVLERYELLYGAGLMEEARRDGREAASGWTELPQLGSPMRFDHRRILATAIGRTRAKIKYRPVVFELMPPEFTLYELQKTVEAILGPHLHKQNFRRLVESAGLVEPTGDVRVKTGGRPAKLYRFRQEVLLERPAPGVRIKSTRAT
jgi:hypothetical protein